MTIFKFLLLNANQKHLQKLFDYKSYDKHLDKYRELQKRITINSNKDVDFAIKLLGKLLNKDHYSYNFSPIEDILKHFTRSKNIEPDYLSHYFTQIIPVLKLIFHHVPESTKGIILETLYCVGTTESVELFIEFVSDVNNHLDNYACYTIIKRFADSYEEAIKMFVLHADKLLKHNNFRTVGFMELFSQWVLEDKLSYNPIQNYLSVIEGWIKKENYDNLSYAISGCAALATIDTVESKKLLQIASLHPKLEIQLEAAFAQILLGNEDAKMKLKLLAQNPIISKFALDYFIELTNTYKIAFDFELKDILSEIKDLKDFIAMCQMSEWCTHPAEYGFTPCSIQVWAKEIIYWPSMEKDLQVYLIRYQYNNYNWQGKIENLDHVGYYIPDTNKAFSPMESFNDIYEAYAACSACDIVKAAALRL